MEVWFIYISITTIAFLSIGYVTRNMFYTRLNFFGWYLIGIVISFIFPYIYCTVTNNDFYYSPTDVNTITISFIVLLSSLFLTYCCYRVGKKTDDYFSFNIAIKRSSACYWVSKLILFYSIFISFYSLILFFINRNIIRHNMVLRNIVFSRVDFITLHGVLLSLPIAVSVFFIYRYINSKEKKYSYFFLFYFILSLFSSFIIGERSFLIRAFFLPLLVLYESYKKNRYLILSSFVIIVFLIFYSILFKVTLIYSTNPINDIIIKDLDMNWNLWYIVENSSLFSSKIISFPGSGYLYNILIFLPREIAPFKGHSTTLQFTYYYGIQSNIPLGADSITQMNWQYKFGIMQEALVNFGYFGLAYFSLLLGLILRYMEKIYRRYKLTYGILAYISMAFSYSPLFTITTLLLPIVLTEIILAKGYGRSEKSPVFAEERRPLQCPQKDHAFCKR